MPPTPELTCLQTELSEDGPPSKRTRSTKRHNSRSMPKHYSQGTSGSCVNHNDTGCICKRPNPSSTIVPSQNGMLSIPEGSCNPKEAAACTHAFAACVCKPDLLQGSEAPAQPPTCGAPFCALFVCTHVITKQNANYCPQ
eukprot:681265-Pelagomonas_calceolata.AAC.3